VERGVVNHTSLWHVCGAQALTSTVVLAAEAAIEAAAAATQASLTQKKASASDSILLAAATAHDRIARGARLGQLSTMELQALVKGVFAARKERGSSKYTSKKETMVQFLGTVEKIGELFGEPPTPPANALADPPRTAARNGLAAPPIVTQSPPERPPAPIDYSLMDQDSLDAHMQVVLAESARRRAALNSSTSIVEAALKQQEVPPSAAATTTTTTTPSARDFLTEILDADKRAPIQVEPTAAQKAQIGKEVGQFL
jgi:hypothetical protein